MKSTKKILFIRRFRKISGGQIKVRDYFRHCLNHPKLEPFIHFTPDSRLNLLDGFWEEAKACMVEHVDLQQYDLLFLAGRDWEHLPDPRPTMPVVNLIQHVKHASREDKRYRFLSKPAYRICVSEAIKNQIKMLAAGPVETIPNGIDLTLFSGSQNGRQQHKLLILGKKNPELGKALYQALQQRGIQATLIIKFVPQEQFVDLLKQHAIFVGLPNRTEGFYLPALEAMACGCAVIVSDAVGNRDFCIPNETALMPVYNHFEETLHAILVLLNDFTLRKKLQYNGMKMAANYGLDRERERFYAFLDRFGLV